MAYILYTVGLIIGIILFLYALSFYESGKERIKNSLSSKNGSSDNKRSKNGTVLNGKEDKSTDIIVNPQNVSFQNIKKPPRERLCPLCGAVLTKYEALYAAQLISKEGNKIMIYGCRYCYKPDKEPEKERKSDI